MESRNKLLSCHLTNGNVILCYLCVQFMNAVSWLEVGNYLSAYYFTQGVNLSIPICLYLLLALDGRYARFDVPTGVY